MSENNNNLHLEEGEKKILIDHSYDGIQELDNPLPSWWKFTFYAGIVFAIFYFILFQIMGAPSLRDEFNKDYAEIKQLQDKFNQQNGAFDEVKYLAIVKDDGVKKGLVVFETNCVPCHLDKGIGDIGPNLTDEYWINSKGTPATNFPVVFNGVPDKGMPTWSQSLSNDEIYQAVAYIQTLHNTHQVGGKTPEGDKVEDKAE